MGNYNAGDGNVGDNNSGSYNIGNGNTGDGNVGLVNGGQGNQGELPQLSGGFFAPAATSCG